MFQQNLSSNIGSRPEIETRRKAIDSVIAFLDSYLPGFPRVFKDKTSNKPIDLNEDEISQLLCNYLERMARKKELFMILFQYRYIKTRRSSDFGIIEVEDHNPTEIDRAFFVIEAKRLPTPQPPKDREKEYVIRSVNKGGLERFKKGLHGVGLSDSAMIGYVQDHDCNYWFQEITSWINDLILSNTALDILWDSNDLLIFESDLITTRKYLSKNTRLVDSVIDSINLHHYLLDLI